MQFQRAFPGLVGLLALCACACGSTPTSLAAGEPCFRTVECADGLACVAGYCSADLTDIVNGGVVPVPPEAGVLPDGAVIVPGDASSDANDLDAN